MIGGNAKASPHLKTCLEIEPMNLQSESINELAGALAKAQGEFTTAKKSADNPFFKSRYADLAEVVAACRAPLAKHGLCVIQQVTRDAAGVVLRSTLAHSSGQWIASEYSVVPVKADPQGWGSAITYARRYSLAALVGVVTDDDDDGNAASGRESGPPQLPQKRAMPKVGPTAQPAQVKLIAGESKAVSARPDMPDIIRGITIQTGQFSGRELATLGKDECAAYADEIKKFLDDKKIPLEKLPPSNAAVLQWVTAVRDAQ